MSSKVFIIHGWTYNLEKWQMLQARLKKDGLEPVMLKVPGLTEPSEQVYEMADYVEWLDAKLKDEKDVILVGHSNGGRIALNYIAAHPGKIAKLVLIDSAGIQNTGLLHSSKLKLIKTSAQVGKVFARSKKLKNLVYRLIGAHDYNQAPPNMKLTMQNMLVSDKDISFAKITVPTVLIWGRYDRATPLKDGEAMNRLIAGSTLHVIDDAYHAPMHTHYDTVADIIEEAIRV